MKNNQTGRSMIEMLGVLAIIGVLSVGGIAGYSKAMAKFRANKTIDQISHIVANTRILFGSQKNYLALGATPGNPTLLSDANIIPDEMKISTKAANEEASMANSFMNPYSGQVRIYVIGRSSATDNRAFIIEYSGIPKDACIDLASQDWNSSSGSGLLAFSVNDTSALENKFYGSCASSTTAAAAATETTEATNGGATTCAIEMPMAVGTALGACNSTTDNKLAWKFY